MKSNTLAPLLHAFFHEWMGKQRNLSHHTVCSYRDTWKLFLRFASERKRREIETLSLADLKEAEVLAFLDHLLRLTDADRHLGYDAAGDHNRMTAPRLASRHRTLDLEV